MPSCMGRGGGGRDLPPLGKFKQYIKVHSLHVVNLPKKRPLTTPPPQHNYPSKPPPPFPLEKNLLDPCMALMLSLPPPPPSISKSE